MNPLYKLRGSQVIFPSLALNKWAPKPGHGPNPYAHIEQQPTHIKKKNNNEFPLKLELSLKRKQQVLSKPYNFAPIS